MVMTEMMVVMVMVLVMVVWAQEEIAKEVGLRKVVEMIHSSNKPLIGHNALLDLLHLYNQIVDPLPNTADAFKEALHTLFPM